MNTGTDSVKGAVTAGFLEDLQFRARERGIDPDVFLALLGTNTKVWWNDLTQNWAARDDW